MTVLGRRTILLALSGAAATAAGCTLGSPPVTRPTVDDLGLIRLLASLEATAILNYQTILDGLDSGRLGPAQPALKAFYVSAQAHHRDHQRAWNKILSQAGGAPQTAVDPVLDAEIKTALRAVQGVADIIPPATRIETTLAQTISSAAVTLGDAGHVAIAARTAAVEAEHAGILQYLGGAELFVEANVVNDFVRPRTDLGKS